MKLKTSASLMVAIVLGAVTAYVGLDVLKKAKGGQAPSTKVVVAARDMEPGYVIEASDLKLEDVPVSLVPAKSFKDAGLVAGRTVLASVVRGYPLIDNQLAPIGSGAGLQAMVPKGMRAVAVEVSEGSAVAGLITPGCYVDVVATFNDGDQQIATTVVHAAKVQFVQRAKPPRSSSSASAAAGSPDALGPVKTVTLIVTPRQANAIELANNQGKPRLLLRGGADDGEVVDATVKRNELLGIPDAPPPPVVEPPAPVEEPVADLFGDEPVEPVANKRAVQVIRGGSETTEYFEEDGNRSFDAGGNAVPAANRQAARRPRRQQSPPQQPPQQQEQPPQPRTPAAVPQEDEDGREQPRTASGASPGEPAPRGDQLRGNLRKGM